MRNYIGLSCSFHDPSLAIVDGDGNVVFAESAERYLQNKRAFDAPPDDINRVSELIETYGDKGADLVIARSWGAGFDVKARVASLALDLKTAVQDRIQALRGRDGMKNDIVSRMRDEHLLWVTRSIAGSIDQAGRNLRLKVRLDTLMGLRRPARHDRVAGRDMVATGQSAAMRGRHLRFVQFDHHLTHAAAACYSSPFEEAVCVVVDADGEHGTTGIYMYRKGRITPVPGPRSTASLGQFYTFLCLGCGFDPIKGEEWKVMGLAPTGTHNERLYRLLRARIEVDGLRVVPGQDRRLFGELLPELGAHPRADVAHAGQAVFEEIMTRLLANVYRLGISRNLVLAGGCALNSSFNGQVLDRTGFQALHVFCAPGDDGNAVGAAQLAYIRDHPDRRPPARHQSPYLGSSLSRRALHRLEALGQVPGMRRCPDPAAEAARFLAEGRIVGWVQGRAEFGPRALGNRSILADPRQPDVKDRINARIKFREPFRPFAPSILHEHGEAWFEHYQASPYMERTLRFREAVRSRVPGVVHVNGTGRLQTVKRAWNEPYYRLIDHFYRLTGVPIVLNTSFNVMGKPIMHSVEDAVAVFFTTGLDALFIEEFVIEKSAGEEAAQVSSHPR